LLLACNSNREISLDSITLKDLDGNEVNIGSLAGNKILVMTFLSPDCPLCISYTKTLRNLKQQFSGKDINFIAVFAGRDYNTKSINHFLQEYYLNIPGVLDPDFKLTRAVKAAVTPEVIVVSRQGDIAYSGAIDNWAYATGKKRTVITRHYLKNAIDMLLQDSLPDPRQTEPIGCFIEI
jgi:peroxiredoxin